MFCFLLFGQIPPIESQSNTKTTTHSIRSAELIDLGLLDIKADYQLNFKIIAPSKIQAGKTSSVIFSPINSQVTTTVTLSGDRLGTFPTDLVYGQQSDFGIPGGYGLSLFIKSIGYAQPTVNGPGYTSTQNLLIKIDNMIPEEFQVTVKNEIGSSSYITLEIPVALQREFGANFSLLGLINQKLTSDTQLLEATPTISIKIPIEKIFDTRLSLQVKDGSNYGYVKVKPVLTLTNGQSLSERVSLYVDGGFKGTINSNQWSSDIRTGSNYHNFKAEFSETRASYNQAVIYQSSSDTTSFNVKSAPPKTTQSAQTTQSKTTQSSLTCGSGTHEENGQCVADGLFGGGCLIATATFGSELAPQVQKLREIRDNSLLKTEVGSAFMESFNQFYYSFSPTIADLERQNPVFKETVKLAITPLITSLSILNYVEIDSEAEMLSYGISLILLNIGMYFVAPAALIWRLRKNGK